MAVKTVAICAVQDPFGYGGAETQIDALKEELELRGYEVELIQVPFLRWEPKIEIIKNCYAWRLLDITEANGLKIDLAVCTKFPSYLVKHPRKVTWLFHQLRQAYELHESEFRFFGDDPLDEQIRQQVIKMDNALLPESKKIFSTSRNVQQRLLRYNHIKSEVLNPPLRRNRSYYCSGYGDFILSVGRLDSHKRVDLLVESARHVRSEAKIYIAGGGPQEQELASKIQNSGLSDRVKLLGHVSEEELLSLYAECLGVYFAPFDEDYGYVTLEAFSSRKPVISTTDSGGVLEFLVHRENGLVSEPDPRDVAANIDQLFGNKGQAELMGKQGYEDIKRIAWDSTIRKLLS